MNKFGAKKAIIDGITFDSQKEANYYSQLLLQKNCKDPMHRVLSIELQPRFTYEIHYHANGEVFKRKAFYRADFRVTYGDGCVEVVDVKGFRTAVYKQKKKIIEALYNLKIIEK
jgi:hypothetical protein